MFAQRQNRCLSRPHRVHQSHDSITNARGVSSPHDNSLALDRQRVASLNSRVPATGIQQDNRLVDSSAQFIERECLDGESDLHSPREEFTQVIGHDPCERIAAEGNHDPPVRRETNLVVSRPRIRIASEPSEVVFGEKRIRAGVIRFGVFFSSEMPHMLQLARFSLVVHKERRRVLCLGYLGGRRFDRRHDRPATH